jgi:hypothetical protein
VQEARSHRLEVASKKQLEQLQKLRLDRRLFRCNNAYPRSRLQQVIQEEKKRFEQLHFDLSCQQALSQRIKGSISLFEAKLAEGKLLATTIGELI